MSSRPVGSPAILVADRDSRSRARLAAFLERAGYTTSEASTGEEALEAISRVRPRLVVLDVFLPGVSGYEVCRRLREEFGDGLPIIFISRERTDTYDRVAGLLIGADDYLPKPFAPEELLARVRALVRRSAPSETNVMKLTRREREVLTLLAQGLDQGAIADRLVISPKTVATHIEHILNKLGVQSRSQAIAFAYRHGLVESSG